jgi:hypothetical protein
MTGVEAAVPASDLRCVLQWVPNTAEGRADRERFERAFAEVETLRAALDAILALPNEHDLLHNAMARAMYEIALAARGGEA